LFIEKQEKSDMVAIEREEEDIQEILKIDLPSSGLHYSQSNVQLYTLDLH
jgi:hypothetical protein